MRVRHFWPLLLVLGCKPPEAAKLVAADVARLELRSHDNRTSLCVGDEPIRLDVAAQLTNGKVLMTAAPRTIEHGRLTHSQFTWSTNLGVVDSGLFQLPDDVFLTVGQTVNVAVSVPERPEVKATATVTPSYDCGGNYGSSGDPGQYGQAGLDGQRGQDGSSGSSDRRASDGSDGGNGSNGGNGSPGGPGEAVEVYLSYVDVPSGERMIVALVVKSSSVQRFLLSDVGARGFTVMALGGAGGGGGSGGNGGAGGRGGGNTSSEGGDAGNGGNGGNGGYGGNGGPGGQGGTITVFYDGRFADGLAQRIAYSTAGGSGGAGGLAGGAGYLGNGGDSSNGTDGADGKYGGGGRDGSRGANGRNGPSPFMQAVDVSEAFAFLADYGLSLATP